MLKSLILRCNLNLYTLLLICIVLTTTSFISIHTIKKLNNSWPIIMDLYQLKSDIASANISLRNAAIAPFEEKDKKISEMLIPRSSATKIYENLSIYPLTEKERCVLEDLKRDRPLYRNAQNLVVDSINKRISFWQELQDYEVHQRLYESRVDSLITSIKLRNEQKYTLILQEFAIAHIITFFGLCFLIVIKK